MTDIEALEAVVSAATETWARDTSNQNLKKALSITLAMIIDMTNQGAAHELDKVESDSHALD